jgi:hypothetical protein
MKSQSSQNTPWNFPPSRDVSTTKQYKRFAYGTAWSGCINLQEVHQLHPDRFHRLRNHRLSKPDHKLTLIFFSSLFGVGLEGPWIKRGDPTVIWPRDWLPKEEEGLGDNILVLSVLCNLRGNQFSVDIGKTVLQELVMEYVCSHLNALLGSFLGAFVSSGSTCDLIMLPVCFPVYVLLYTRFRQGHCTELLSSSENDLNYSQPLIYSIPEVSKSPILVQISVLHFRTRSPQISTRVQA